MNQIPRPDSTIRLPYPFANLHAVKCNKPTYLIRFIHHFAQFQARKIPSSTKNDPLREYGSFYGRFWVCVVLYNVCFLCARFMNTFFIHQPPL